MKLTTFIVITAILQVSANSFAQKITLSEKNVTLTKILKEIRTQSGYDFLYKTEVLNKAKRVSIQVKDATLKQVLEIIFKEQPFEYIIDEQAVTLSKKIPSSPSATFANIELNGTVLDDENLPLQGATIVLKGTNRTTITGTKGEFAMANVPDNAVIMVRYIGYTSLEISLKGAAMPLKIKLNRVASALDEVKVVASTGYQLLPKERATGSFDVISNKQIRNKIQTNVLERLEGIAPGLMMINGKDNGSDGGLTIRGVSTLYGNKRPLIVVDNFPIEGDINSINPNDVESITLLKDAAAASIWGARAANGVIVITTKRGRQGDMQFTYTNSFQFEAKPDLGYLNRLNAADDIAIDRKLITPAFERRTISTKSIFSRFAALYMDSVAGRITPQQYLSGINNLSSLDNTQQIKDLLMQQPFTQSHTFSFNGGTEKSQYYGSVNYNGENGYNLKDQNSNYNVFLKTTHKISNRLSLGINANLNMNSGTGAPVSAIDVFRLKPYNILQDATGNPLSVITDKVETNLFNMAQRRTWGLNEEAYYPLKELDNTEISSRDASQRLQAEISYKIAAGISLNLSYQLEKGNSYQKTYLHAGQAGLTKEINDFITPSKGTGGQILENADRTLLNPTYNLPLGGKITEWRSDYSSHVIRGLLNIDKTFAGNHQISAIIGVENKATQTSGSSVTKYGYDDNTLNFVAVDAQRLKKIVGTLRVLPFNGINDSFIYNEDRFVSAFANASYTFKNKYVYSGSIRMDQTNLFGTDPKYLYRPLWSSGLSWIASNEEFLKNNNLVNYLQFRATYGINGNIPKNSGPFLIAQARTNYYNNLPSNAIVTPANSQLRWEKTAVANLGADFSILKNRISGKFDYYRRQGTDLLGSQTINASLGFSNAIVNTASMTNHGFEIELTTKNIRKEQFGWSTTFAYALNRNKITKIALASDYFNPLTIASGTPYLVGKPYGGMYSARYAGLTPDGGQLLLRNAQGEIQPDEENLNLDFVYYSGNRRPVSNGALTNVFTYKNLELSAMFIFYAGHINRQSMPITTISTRSFDGRLAQAWQKPGDENHTIVPNVVLDANNHLWASTYANYLDVNVFNASYLKLREVILTYNFPQKTFRHLKYIKGLQLNAQARNLWTLTKNKLGIDPEAFSNGTRTMPIAATYAFGINLNF